MAAYYFDGDTIVMDLVKKTSYTETVTIKRRIKYVDQNGNEVKYRDTDGTLKIYPEVDVPVKQISFTGKYNPLTGHQDPIDQDQFKKLALEDSPIPNQIGGYLHIYMYSAGSTQSVIGVPADTIYSNVNILDQQAKHGYEVDIDQAGIPVKKQQEDAIDPHTINIIQDVTLTYVPSHANLILVGAGLGQTNQLLSSSSSVNADGSTNKLINFVDPQGHVINDASLHRDGYTYQVYYYNDTLNSFTLADGLDSVHYVNRSWLTNTYNPVTAYSTLADAFAGKANGATDTNQTYDSSLDFQLDDNQQLNTNLGVAGYTQNFFVVYTPVEQRKQTLYILSDNDPYANDPFMKDFALPKTTADADKSGTDFFKVQGETGDYLIHTNTSGIGFNTFVQPGGSDTNYSTAEYDYDSEGHQIHHHIPYSDNTAIAGQLGMIPIYERTGYYIPKATYQFTDDVGKTHTVTITNHLDLTKYDHDQGEYGSGDPALLTILDYLTTGSIPGYTNPITLPASSDAAFTISVDGITGAKLTTTDSGIAFELPTDQTWVYDDTVYDNSNHANIDPQPQIITLSYAALPVDPESTQVHIHYIDVDQVSPMSDSDRQSEVDQGIKLHSLTDRYSVNQTYDSKAQEWDPTLNQWTSTDSSNGETYNITKADQDFDNTANDDAIIAKLAQQGYVVVQRDAQTRGRQQFNPSSSDYGNGSWDGNSQLPTAGNSNVSSQNYYVYLKKAHQVQYRVLVEDADGNVESQPLVDKTLLGVGGTNENVAKTLVDWNKVDWQKDSGETIGQKYDQIIADLATSQPNYTVVPHDSTDTKLKKTDTIAADATFTGAAPLLYTIYVTHKQGDVHIHYIDVNGKKPSGKNDKYVSTDGTEIPSTEQSITNKNYGDTYTNTPWDFAAHHYVLAETEPTGATNGTVDAPSADVYVYLKHGTEAAPSRSKTVTETIHYVYKGGKTAHADAPTQTLHFTQKGTKDLVTNAITYGDWTAAQSFTDVTSPSITGYTPDIANVVGPQITVTNDNYSHDLNVVKTVTYVPDTQTLTVKYIDDVTGKTLTTITKTGDSDADAKYNTKSDIAKYEDQHYQLISDNTKGKELFFDHDDKVDQSYEVHLTHETEPNSGSETITRTIVDHVPGKKPTTTKQPVIYTRTGTKDLVTGDTTWQDWTSQNDLWNSYTAIGKPGYTPNLATVNTKIVQPTDKDTSVDIYYKADAQKLTVKYIDDTTGKTLKTVTRSGSSDADAKYNTKSDIDTYLGQHYRLVSDNTNGRELVFDHDDKVDQSYEVHLTHVTQPATESKTITRTIVDHVPGQKPITTKQPVTFERTGIKDLVTGHTTWNDWNSKDPTWQAYLAHGKPGYTPNITRVSAKTVKTSDQDTKVDIYYSGDNQKLTVTYIDDTTGKTLKTVIKQGSSDSDAKYNTKSDLDGYLNDHYQLVSDSTKGQELIFDHDDALDQSYEVHLTHQTEPATDSKTITRTIVDHVPGQAPIITKQTVTFTRTGATDLVTNQTIWNEWTSTNDQWVKYVAQGKDGYTPNIAIVASKEVHPTDFNVQIDIYYMSIPEDNHVKQNNPKLTTPVGHPSTTPVSHSPIGHRNKEANEVSVTKITKTTPTSHVQLGTIDNVVRDREHQIKHGTRLPQTGSDENQLGLIGLGMSFEAALLSLLLPNKRKH